MLRHLLNTLKGISLQRDHVINKAREVIHKSLNTVQQIAFLLGENASESEVLLEQIIDSFSPDKADDLR